MIGLHASTAGELRAILEGIDPELPVVDFDRRLLAEVEVWEAGAGSRVRFRFGRPIRPSYGPAGVRRP